MTGDVDVRSMSRIVVLPDAEPNEAASGSRERPAFRVGRRVLRSWRSAAAWL